MVLSFMLQTTIIQLQQEDKEVTANETQTSL